MSGDHISHAADGCPLLPRTSLEDIGSGAPSLMHQERAVTPPKRCSVTDPWRLAPIIAHCGGVLVRLVPLECGLCSPLLGFRAPCIWGCSGTCRHEADVWLAPPPPPPRYRTPPLVDARYSPSAWPGIVLGSTCGCDTPMRLFHWSVLFADLPFAFLFNGGRAQGSKVKVKKQVRGQGARSEKRSEHKVQCLLFLGPQSRPPTNLQNEACLPELAHAHSHNGVRLDPPPQHRHSHMAAPRARARRRHSHAGLAKQPTGKTS